MTAPQAPFRPLFVCGSPKSGTTWLQKILDAHPQIACAGEGHFIEHIANPMVRLLRSYNGKLKQVDEVVFEGRAPYPPITEGEIIQIVREIVVKLMLRQQPPAGIMWVGDKTPRYTNGLKELKALFPAAQFVHIIRDPRDVAVSRLFYANRAGYEDALTTGSDTYYELIENAAAAWLQHNGNVAAFGTAPGTAATLHQLRYERLLSDFDTVAQELFAFLGVDCSPSLIAVVRAATDFEVLSGRKPGEEDLGSFFRKGVAGDWQERLDRRALEIIEGQCKELMARYGYTDLSDACA